MSIHNSRVLTRHTPCLPEQRILTFKHGTRLTVRDLFGAMPVRVKHRAVQAERSNFGRDWDRLLLDLVALMLPWPKTVCISIREASNRQKVTLKTSLQPGAWLNDACRLLHQASLCDSPDIIDWVAIGASSPTLSISGYVCREPVATKRVQFISLGIEPMCNQSRCNVLYEEVNRIFAESSFGTIEDVDSDNMSRAKRDGFTNRELKVTKGVDRWPMFFLKMTPSTTFARGIFDVDEILSDYQPNLSMIIDLLKAMFYEFLKKSHCRPKKAALSTKANLRKQRDPGQTTTAEDFEPTSSPHSFSRHSGPNSLLTDGPIRKAARLQMSEIAPDSSFGTWSKIKSGQSLNTFQKSMKPVSQTRSGSTTPIGKSRSNTPVGILLEKSKHTTPSEPCRPPLYDANGKLTRMPFDDIDHRGGDNTERPELTNKPLVSLSVPPEDETFQWINPFTNMAVTVNSRTGFAIPPRPLTLSRRAIGPDEANRANHQAETTPWVQELISKWKNPVFECTEAPIPKLPDVSETLGLDVKAAGHKCYHGYEGFHIGTRHETAAMNFQGRMTRDALRNAKLIAQVDKKFIFARVPFSPVSRLGQDETPSQSSVLVLIDQHAADERRRVEELMQDYFTPTTDDTGSQFWIAFSQAMPEPIQFELSALDRDVLCESQRYFAHWGIFYEVDHENLRGQQAEQRGKKTTKTTKARVSVHRLPPAILERCRTEPRLLAELIRKEAWRLRDETGSTEPPRPKRVSVERSDVEAPVWVSLFHGCPPGILDLINSRSCRSESLGFLPPTKAGRFSDVKEQVQSCSTTP